MSVMDEGYQHATPEGRRESTRPDPYMADAMAQAKARANHFGKPVAIWLTVAGKDKAYSLRNVEESMDEAMWAYYGVVDPEAQA